MAAVFISFAQEESVVAIALQRLLIKHVGSLSVFLTADRWQMLAGENWLDRIKAELRSAKVLLAMMSKHTLGRPWINFEAGAAWLSGTVVIPVCYWGLSASEVPRPYGDFQAVELEKDDDVYLLVRSVATAVGHAIQPPPTIYGSAELTELQKAVAIQPEAAVRSSAPLPQLASEILKEASVGPTGEITRHDLDQRVVVKANGKSWSASTGRERADLDGALRLLEERKYIRVESGDRFLFAVTAEGYLEADRH